MYQLERHQLIPFPPAEVFSFFAEAGNLQEITPPWLDFRILTPLPIALRDGALLDYSIRWRIARVTWRTEIVDWAPPHRFIDRQIRGPYQLWVHQHTFDPHPQGTLMTDRVSYALPFGLLGRLAHFLIVRRDLEAIFEYRGQRIAERFGSVECPPLPPAPGVRHAPRQVV
jgi:ligand-binding SRPBCC domain-containing protein